MSDLFREAVDATPLSTDERDGLKQSWITHRQDLNEAEQRNIMNGAAWARRVRKKSLEALLSEDFIRDLHKHMFADVWKWAGSYRNSGKNIGIDAYLIPSEILNLVENVHFWLNQNTYALDEIAVRFHHRLVFIHPFPNGNGRHARLMADLLLERSGRHPFSWGENAFTDDVALRRRYIQALKAADAHDIKPLLLFARS